MFLTHSVLSTYSHGSQMLPTAPFNDIFKDKVPLSFSFSQLFQKPKMEEIDSKQKKRLEKEEKEFRKKFKVSASRCCEHDVAHAGSLNEVRLRGRAELSSEPDLG